MNKYFLKIVLGLLLCGLGALVYAADTSSGSQIAGVTDMLDAGNNLLKKMAKIGGVATVVGAALALGSGKLEGALAQTICKILIVVGLLIAAFSFFEGKIGVAMGFNF